MRSSGGMAHLPPSAVNYLTDSGQFSAQSVTAATGVALHAREHLAFQWAALAVCSSFDVGRLRRCRQRLTGCQLSAAMATLASANARRISREISVSAIHSYRSFSPYRDCRHRADSLADSGSTAAELRSAAAVAEPVDPGTESRRNDTAQRRHA